MFSCHWDNENKWVSVAKKLFCKILKVTTDTGVALYGFLLYTARFQKNSMIILRGYG